MPSELRNLVGRAIATDRELNEALSHTKLTPKVYLAEAMRNANTTNVRLNALQKALDKPENMTSEIEHFIRAARLNFIEMKTTPVPAPAEKFSKMARIYGSVELPGELALIGFSVGTVFALACRQAAQQRPQHFGDVENWLQHEQDIQRLRDKRSALVESMSDAICGADILVDDRGAFVMGSDVKLKRGWEEELLLFESQKPTTKKARVKLAA